MRQKNYRYFKPYNNTEIFDFPLYISNRRDFKKIEKKTSGNRYM